VRASDINFGYGAELLWEHPLNLQICSSDRIVIKGANGSGKTTLIKMILGELMPTTGAIEIATSTAIYADQDYSLINDVLTVYEQAQLFNSSFLQEHEIKIRLTRFLFTKESWDKPCAALSGGERMRLVLCCLTIRGKAPDIMILDEPTNNLDIQNTEILTNAINEYKGTLVVVSHDQRFLKEINAEETINLR
jgi:ATPase subunit of ABC transporter with duplicated ATPase domains